MRNLLLLILLLAGGYYAYQYFTEEPPPPAVVQNVVAPTPVPVDFTIKAKVRKLFEEWKRLSLGAPGRERGVRIDPALELKEIRRKLFEKGVYSGDAVNDVVVRSLREIGVPEKEINEVAGGIMSMQ
ncbi:MAG: hypothetical protein RIQ71_736 [Verrucomicrobiota bacterium]